MKRERESLVAQWSETERERERESTVWEMGR
jgi:hypothetical protein